MEEFNNSADHIADLEKRIDALAGAEKRMNEMPAEPGYLRIKAPESPELRELRATLERYLNPYQGLKFQIRAPREPFRIMFGDDGLTLGAAGGSLVTLRADGSVTLGEGISAEHAAHEFYQALLLMRDNFFRPPPQ